MVQFRDSRWLREFRLWRRLLVRVSLQLRLCLTFLQAAASLRLRDLGRRLCLLFDLCRSCLLVAEQASGQCFRLFCALGDQAILATGFGVVLP